jgi:hypothetical protein
VSLLCDPGHIQEVCVANGVARGCEPLTPEDIAEVIVFAAGRRENVVVADTLIFPNHQVCHVFVHILQEGTDMFIGRSHCDAQERLNAQVICITRSLVVG